MLRLLTLVVVSITLLIGGCKIRISPPEGGRVVTQSGSFLCESGQVCEVEVTDTEFDLTFIAEPASGFVFDGWRRRDRGLCGGSIDPCRLFTSGFVGQPALLEFLSSDEVFFLEPVFRSSDGGNLGAGSLAACLPQNQSATFRNRVTPPGLVTITNQAVDGTQVFAGNPSIRVRLDLEFEDFTGGGTSTVNYVSEVENLRQQVYGVEVFTEGPPATTSISTYSPSLEFRFDLSPGESHTQTVNASTRANPGTAVEEVIEQTITVTRRYLGRETITVPAGTFETCRLETETRTTDASGVVTTARSTLWQGVGTGLSVRQQDGSAESGNLLTVVLLSATIDG